MKKQETWFIHDSSTCDRTSSSSKLQKSYSQEGGPCHNFCHASSSSIFFFEPVGEIYDLIFDQSVLLVV